MERNRLLDLLAVLIIALLGLFTAYVTFGILQSQANAKTQGYSVSGAFAGAVISSSLLTSIYLQLRKSSGEAEKLQGKIEELQSKVMRGAPRPKDFDSEIDERRRLVLARPTEWQPKGGTLFDFDFRRPVFDEHSPFPGQFKVNFSPITPDMTTEKYFEAMERDTETHPFNLQYSSEYIYIGSEPQKVKCLKATVRQHAKLEVRPDLVTSKPAYEWWPISEEEYREEIEKPARPGSDPAMNITRLVDITRMHVFCFHEELKVVFLFMFVDEASNFVESSQYFSQTLESVRFLT